ncbi:MAG: hypothetical protein HC904_10785 [Blastochloris sp.]|nr:hypothetical protein [Blastochloris sp.]
MWQAFTVSSNIAFAKVGLSLGENKLHRYIQEMGFGNYVQNPEQAISGEQKGLIRDARKWHKVDLTRIPIGYGVAVTNLQMTMAVGAIANEGKLMEPRLIKAVVDKDGRKVKEYLPKVLRQVVSRETAVQVAEVMKNVVQEENGTGVKARVKDFTVAGKTGTARKLVNGVYAHGIYYSSFIGFLPANDPEFLVSIVVDEPRATGSGNSHLPYGGKVAAPSFSRISTQVAEELGLHRESDNNVMADRRVRP